MAEARHLFVPTALTAFKREVNWNSCITAIRGAFGVEQLTKAIRHFARVKRLDGPNAPEERHAKAEWLINQLDDMLREYFASGNPPVDLLRWYFAMLSLISRESRTAPKYIYMRSQTPETYHAVGLDYASVGSSSDRGASHRSPPNNSYLAPNAPSYLPSSSQLLPNRNENYRTFVDTSLPSYTPSGALIPSLRPSSASMSTIPAHAPPASIDLARVPDPLLTPVSATPLALFETTSSKRIRCHISSVVQRAPGSRVILRLFVLQTTIAAIHGSARVQRSAKPSWPRQVALSIGTRSLPYSANGYVDITGLVGPGVNELFVMPVVNVKAQKPAEVTVGGVVQEMRVHSIPTLLGALQAFPPSHTINLVRKSFTSVDSDVVEVSRQVSLIDNVSRARMKYPARSTTCTHVQVFDAEVWLKLHERDRVWKCPLCGKDVEWHNVALDSYFTDVLNSVDTTVTEVTLRSDGSWVKSVIEPPPNAATIVLDSDEGESSDHEGSTVLARGAMLKKETKEATPAEFAESILNSEFSAPPPFSPTPLPPPLPGQRSSEAVTSTRPSPAVAPDKPLQAPLPRLPPRPPTACVVPLQEPEKMVTLRPLTFPAPGTSAPTWSSNNGARLSDTFPYFPQSTIPAPSRPVPSTSSLVPAPPQAQALQRPPSALAHAPEVIDLTETPPDSPHRKQREEPSAPAPAPAAERAPSEEARSVEEPRDAEVRVEDEAKAREELESEKQANERGAEKAMSDEERKGGAKGKSPESDQEERGEEEVGQDGAGDIAEFAEVMEISLDEAQEDDGSDSTTRSPQRRSEERRSEASKEIRAELVEAEKPRNAEEVSTREDGEREESGSERFEPEEVDAEEAEKRKRRQLEEAMERFEQWRKERQEEALNKGRVIHGESREKGAHEGKRRDERGNKRQREKERRRERDRSRERVRERRDRNRGRDSDDDRSRHDRGHGRDEQRKQRRSRSDEDRVGQRSRSASDSSRSSTSPHTEAPQLPSATSERVTRPSILPSIALRHAQEQLSMSSVQRAAQSPHHSPRSPSASKSSHILPSSHRHKRRRYNDD